MTTHQGMTARDLADLLRQGATLAFDTNLARQHEPLRHLHRALKSLRPQVRLVASALVHTEGVMDAHTEGRAEAVIPLEIEAFTPDDARAVGRWLHQQHPTDVAWQRAKRTLAVRQLRATSYEANARASATIDWWIAGHAQVRGWILVTHDRGDEFRGVTHLATGAHLLAAVRLLTTELPDDLRFETI